jgi:LysM repeat protein
MLPWVLAGAALFALAALGGFGAADVVTTAQAVPTVDPGKLPTPTPTQALTSPIPSGGPSPSSRAIPSPSVSVSTSPSAAPTESAGPSATGNGGPSPTPISYVVQRGDRLTAIAAQFGVSVDAIVALNNIKNPDHIEAGQVLLIPVP